MPSMPTHPYGGEGCVKKARDKREPERPDRWDCCTLVAPRSPNTGVTADGLVHYTCKAAKRADMITPQLQRQRERGIYMMERRSNEERGR